MNGEVFALSRVAERKAYRNLRLRFTTRLASVPMQASMGGRFEPGLGRLSTKLGTMHDRETPQVKSGSRLMF